METTGSQRRIHRYRCVDHARRKNSTGDKHEVPRQSAGIDPAGLMRPIGPRIQVTMVPTPPMRPPAPPAVVREPKSLTKRRRPDQLPHSQPKRPLPQRRERAKHIRTPIPKSQKGHSGRTLAQSQIGRNGREVRAEEVRRCDADEEEEEGEYSKERTCEEDPGDQVRGGEVPV